MNEDNVIRDEICMICHEQSQSVGSCRTEQVFRAFAHSSIPHYGVHDQLSEGGRKARISHDVLNVFMRADDATCPAKTFRESNGHDCKE